MRGGEVRGIGDLLKKYKSLRAPQGAVIDAFIDAVRECCAFTLKRSVVRYVPRTKTLYVSLSGPGKQELLLKRSALIAGCIKRLGPEQAPQHIV